MAVTTTESNNGMNNGGNGTPKKDGSHTDMTRNLSNESPPRSGDKRRNISPITRQNEQQRGGKGPQRTDTTATFPAGVGAGTGIDGRGYGNQNIDPQVNQSRSHPPRRSTIALNDYEKFRPNQHEQQMPLSQQQQLQQLQYQQQQQDSDDFSQHPQDQSYSTFSISSLLPAENGQPSHQHQFQQNQQNQRNQKNQNQTTPPENTNPLLIPQQKNLQNPQKQNKHGSPNPPPPPPPAVSTQQGRRRSVIMPANTITNQPHSTSPQQSNSQSPTSSATNPQIVYIPTLPEGAMDAEGAQALIASLEALRNEVHTLRHALAVSQQSAAYYKEECRKLADIRREEGSTLRVQDRAKLKSTIQDLKDYEVYREVMESAMTRMQNEMDTIEKENHEMREVQKQLEKELRKVKSQQAKYQKDIETAQKSRKDLSKKLEFAEEQLRNLSKEKDVSITTLSQFKSEKGREVGELQTSNHKKEVEIKNMKKKIIELESKLQSTINENSATSILHDQELNKLRAAHTKSLEMLMSYQEENELLRSAMTELVEKQQQYQQEEHSNHNLNENKSNNNSDDGGSDEEMEFPTAGRGGGGGREGEEGGGGSHQKLNNEMTRKHNTDYISDEGDD